MKTVMARKRYPTLDRSEPRGSYVTTMEVVGTLPITFNSSSTKRQSYRDWLVALDRAAQSAADRARPTTARLFSLRCELRLFASTNGSDLDNYVKPIQDALAKHGVFGETEFVGSSMKGDEHVDHLDLRRKRVESPKDAGVLAEVWALTA
jgi:Holliday junction resolvase RusA-like endonuclease